jgi:putative membrane-bound dehydrogenase-like protein
MGCLKLRRCFWAHSLSNYLVVISGAFWLCRSGHAAPAAVPTERPATNAAPSLRVKPGFRVEVVAGQGMIAGPVAMAFDENGRLFVAESHDWPGRGNPFQKLGRIRVLEDTDGDGTFDSSSLYAQDLPAPTALTCYNGGLFVAAGPEIIFLKEGIETRKTIFSGFGGMTNFGRESSGVLNSLNWGLDNRIHCGSAGAGGNIITATVPGAEAVPLGENDFAFDPASPELLVEAGTAQTSLCFDNTGRRYVGGLVWPFSWPTFEPRYLERNPFYAGPDARIGIVSAVTPVYRFKSPQPFKPWTVRPPQPRGDVLEPVWVKQARGAVVYRGNAFPSNYLENVFIPEAEARVIHRAILVENGLGYSALRAADEQNGEFLFSTDTNFCPMQVVNAPDGGLYVADWQNGGDSGRILRIVPAGFRSPKPPQLGKAKTMELATTFTNLNGWHRDTAARLLYEKYDMAVVTLLTNMFNNSRLPLTRLHALYALDGPGAVREAQVVKALQDADSRVRERAVVLAEEFTGSDSVWSQLGTMVYDPSMRVRYQLAFSLGQFQRPNRARLLTQLLLPFPENTWMQEAALSSLVQGGSEVLVALADTPAWRGSATGLEFLEELARMVGTEGNWDGAKQVMDFLDRSQFERMTTFRILYGLGDGLLHTLSSLDLIDPNFRLQRLYEDAVIASNDPNLPAELRVAAIHVRGVRPHIESDREAYDPPILDPTEPQSLQSATIWLMAKYDGWMSVTNLVNRWSSLNPVCRNDVLNEMVSWSGWLRMVLAWVDEGRVQTSDFDSTQLNILRTWPDEAIRDWALRLFGPVPGRHPELVQQFRGALGAAGNVARGRQLFVNRCANCHQCADTGQVFGPDLTKARNWSRERILSAILEPNAQVTPHYETQVMAARSGEVRTGILRNDNTKSLTLRQPGGNSEVWPRLAVAWSTRQSWSLMPEGLERGLGVDDMASLLAYLTAGGP